jgi:hypothetical protein
MATLIEKSDLAFNAQLKTFAGNIDNYSTPLGLTSAEVNSVKADSLALSYMMDGQDAVQTFSPTFTAYKDLLRKGGADALGPVPLGPVLPTPPPMPAPNVESRFRKLVQRIVNHPAYTPAIGEGLGIEAPSAAASKTALVAGKPKFFIEPSSGGHPNLRWTKGKFEGVEIWKDSGNGFAKLDRDMKPDYIDKTDLPKAGTTALWKYKMIYLMDDEPIGNWSDEVSVTVFGEV